jgi:hypothetical protein
MLKLLPFGGFFICELPTLALHGINDDSAGNYCLMDKESTGEMVIPRELPAQGLVINRRNKITTGIISVVVITIFCICINKNIQIIALLDQLNLTDSYTAGGRSTQALDSSVWR